MTGRFVIAAMLVWGVWGASWLVAALWRGRTVGAAQPRSYVVPLWIGCAGFGCLFVGPLHARAPLWAVPAWLGFAMVALIVTSAGFAWWARLHLGNLWSAAIVRREGHRIVDTGPYAWVRHPIYTALIGGAIGLAVIRATPLALLGVGLIALGFGLKARIEERFLAAELGEQAYAAYRARVPMLVPLLH